QVNDGQPRFVVEKVKQVLGDLNGKKIAALGLAYKSDVDDLRESPASNVVRLLQGEGAHVQVWEPFKPGVDMQDIHMASSLEAALSDADLLLLLVRHTEFVQYDPAEIAARTRSRLLLDCVNGWNPELWKQAGFSVFRLGVNKPLS
ncbi:MAG TPA: UDP binding domain-containing protein, partial [Anaerolineales bacterium]|nr:UDP binding domain-containing protein [Anaerolineales bacterium]